MNPYCTERKPSPVHAQDEEARVAALSKLSADLQPRTLKSVPQGLTPCVMLS
jgi:hypothetical protein